MAVALAAAAAALAAPAGAAADPAPATCAGSAAIQGGEWRHFGHDYSNTRNQDAEKVISPGDAATLSPAWTFSTKDAGGEGDITGTPIVADGCVYVATARGWAYALNADTGKLVWKAKLPYGGGVTGTVGLAPRTCGKTVTYRRKVVKRHGKRKAIRKRIVKTKSCGTVYVAASRTQKSAACPPGDECKGPYVIALDQATGAVAWATPALDTQPGSDVYGSPVIFDGTLMIGISGVSAELGGEDDRYAFQGSMVFLDASTGALLRKTWTIHPPKQPEDDYAGAAIWSTPAVDPARKVAYVGTGNPFRPQAEHKYANSVVKFDVNRKSATFGQIVGSYKGLIDEYISGFSDLPCYDIPGNPPPYYPQGIGGCGDIDLDFGASPNLFTDSKGRKLVGAGQKSGVFHVFDADTMKPEWTQIVGPPGSLGGIVGSTAYDGQSFYGPITVPGYAWSLSADGGGYRWIAPTADGAHWGPPVAVANGVVYSVDTTGFLDAFDARTGFPLAKRPLSLGGSPPALDWGGVSIARNTIYAGVGLTSGSEGQVIAFRPGTVQDAPGDAQETIGRAGGGGGGGGGLPAGSTIVAVPGSTYTTYATPVMTTRVGGPLSFMNFDLPQHDVVSDAKAPDGLPLFHSKLSGLGEVSPVEGLERVQAGQSYGFFCSIHPGMRGTLIVQ